jgi:hypothetical protein
MAKGEKTKRLKWWRRLFDCLFFLILIFTPDRFRFGIKRLGCIRWRKVSNIISKAVSFNFHLRYGGNVTTKREMTCERIARAQHLWASRKKKRNFCRIREEEERYVIIIIKRGRQVGRLSSYIWGGIYWAAFHPSKEGAYKGAPGMKNLGEKGSV